MNAKTMITSCLIVILSVSVIFLGSTVMQLQDDNKALSAELDQAQAMNVMNEQKIDNMYSEKISLKSIILALEEDAAVQSVLVDKYMEISSVFDVDSISKEDLSKAKEISDATPLDGKTALVIVDYAKKFNVPVSLILSVIELESQFDQYIVGGANDRGYMQVIPSTEKWLAETFGDRIGISYDPSRIFESEYNIGLGTYYLSILINAYGTDYDRVLSEYNRGPSNLKKYYEANQTYRTAYSSTVLSKQPKYLEFND